MITELYESSEDIYITTAANIDIDFNVVKNTYTIQEYIDKYNINIFVSNIKLFEKCSLEFKVCVDKSEIVLINKIKEKFMEYFI